ncbi:uncharacterized protein BDR25DRAFT_361799 [Lindgomyces ingoldianus]|uniref:Uncharacterized protein n=1 Tax=Lindgomyces ingoldianus TaxID=673940 RepID=A0ACB6QBL1_9PLEO|nr:uncharacterized protein BDR25DRAFT_361799 [Lindgomyces ingoldianus]KAF2464297.1 hypothetical protein BDR25DRAFT_361799 [Lindgomyces ingoldianus]
MQGSRGYLALKPLSPFMSIYRVGVFACKFENDGLAIFTPRWLPSHLKARALKWRQKTLYGVLAENRHFFGYRPSLGKALSSLKAFYNHEITAADAGNSRLLYTKISKCFGTILSLQYHIAMLNCPYPLQLFGHSVAFGSSGRPERIITLIYGPERNEKWVWRKEERPKGSLTSSSTLRTKIFRVVHFLNNFCSLNTSGYAAKINLPSGTGCVSAMEGVLNLKRRILAPSIILMLFKNNPKDLLSFQGTYIQEGARTPERCIGESSWSRSGRASKQNTNSSTRLRDPIHYLSWIGTINTKERQILQRDQGQVRGAFGAQVVQTHLKRIDGESAWSLYPRDSEDNGMYAFHLSDWENDVEEALRLRDAERRYIRLKPCNCDADLEWVTCESKKTWTNAKEKMPRLEKPQVSFCYELVVQRCPVKAYGVPCPIQSFDTTTSYISGNGVRVYGLDFPISSAGSLLQIEVKVRSGDPPQSNELAYE